MTAFEFVPEPENVLKKLFSRLKPGGCLLIGLIAGRSAWSEYYGEASRNNPTSVFARAALYTKEEIGSWQIGVPAEIGECLFFPPNVNTATEARGGTKFTPVFEYTNSHKVNLLVYFTDGKGEEKLLSIPRGYKTLWVISGKGDKLSLKEAYGAVKELKNIEIKDDSLTMSDVKRDGYSMNDQERMHV